MIQNKFLLELEKKNEQLMVGKYGAIVAKIKKDLGNLDGQVCRVTAGDFDVIQRRATLLKFDPSRKPE